MKWTILCFLLLAGFGTSWAQSAWCDADIGDYDGIDRDRWEAFQQRNAYARSGEMRSVGITVHIVETVDGASNLDVNAIQREIDLLNDAYLVSDLRFFLCGSPRSLRGEPIYNHTTGNTLNAQNYVPNTINVYYVDDLEGGEFQPICGFARFPWMGTVADRYIMIDKSCATDGATLAHEIGHFYGLLHTHETARGRELVDRSNCERAGDEICDTAADPNLSRPGALNSCTYVGNFRDAKGDTYSPHVWNIMSYAPARCVRRFSEGQYDRIRFYSESENDYLIDNCDFYPDFSISSDATHFSIRADESIQVTYRIQSVGLSEPTELIVHFAISDDPDEIDFVVKKDTILLPAGDTDLVIDYDIVFPLYRGSGDYFLTAIVDGGFSILERLETNNFHVSTIRVDNSSLMDVTLFPNPATDELKLFIRDKFLAGDLRIGIYQYDGRLMQQTTGFKDDPEYFQIINISDLPPGMYILTVDYEKFDDRQSFRFFKR